MTPSENPPLLINGPPTPFGAYWLTDATPGDNSSSGDADL
jgi:hypothetical protein